VLTGALEAALQTDEVQSWSDETGNVVEYGGPESASNAVADAFEQIPNRSTSKRSKKPRTSRAPLSHHGFVIRRTISRDHVY